MYEDSGWIRQNGSSADLLYICHKYQALLFESVHAVARGISTSDGYSHIYSYKYRIEHSVFLRGHMKLFSINYLLQSLMNVFVLANSADPHEMSNFTAFHLGAKIAL